jgi:hypothetical protein
MKRLAVFLIVLLVLAVVADFGARVLIENLAGRALASRRGVNGSVDISLGGFPFLLHLKDREFSSVTVEAEDVRGGSFAAASGISAQSEARIDSVLLDMRDVTIRGNLWGEEPDRAVTATSGEGTASIGTASLNRMVPEEYGARLTLLDGAVRVTAETPTGEQSAEVAADQVRIDPEQGTLVIEAPPPVGGILIPLPELVRGIRFGSVEVERGSIDLTFALSDVRLEL